MTRDVLIACVDVDYRDSGAVAAALWFAVGQLPRQNAKPLTLWLDLDAPRVPAAWLVQGLQCQRPWPWTSS